MKLLSILSTSALITIVVGLLLKFIIMAFEYDWTVSDFPLYNKLKVISFSEHLKTGPGSTILRPIISAQIADCNVIQMEIMDENDKILIQSMANKVVIPVEAPMAFELFDRCDTLKSYAFKRTRIYCKKVKGDTLVFYRKKIDW